MPKEVTVDLKDLRFLVKIMLGFSIESRAHKLLRQSQIPKNKAAVNRYMAALRVAIPQGEDGTRETIPRSFGRGKDRR
jgi:hypothetical protein